MVVITRVFHWFRRPDYEALLMTRREADRLRIRRHTF
jgi:hypothetical protein